MGPGLSFGALEILRHNHARIGLYQLSIELIRLPNRGLQNQEF